MKLHYCEDLTIRGHTMRGPRPPHFSLLFWTFCTDTVMKTYETCWLATGNSWLSLVSREAADIKRLIFAWSSIQKKKLLLLATIARRLVFTSHKLEINVPWLAAESVCVVCVVVMCGAKIFFVWIIVERRMKLISQILVLFKI